MVFLVSLVIFSGALFGSSTSLSRFLPSNDGNAKNGRGDGTLFSKSPNVQENMTFKYSRNDNSTANTESRNYKPFYSHDVIVNTLFDMNKLPYFMSHYFEWHREQLELLYSGKLTWEPGMNETTHPKFLILRCRGNDRCGGTSDRIRSFPLFILLAAQAQRLLFIRWGRPFPIEEFMVPTGIWNWTVPAPLMNQLEALDRQEVNGTKGHQRVYADGNKMFKLRKNIVDPNVWIVEGNDQNGGADLYRNLVMAELEGLGNHNHRLGLLPNSGSWNVGQGLSAADAEYSHFYHDLFHATFQPSPGVKADLESYIRMRNSASDDSQEEGKDGDLGLLQPNQYTVVHYRAMYPTEMYAKTKNVAILKEKSLHAVECAVARVPSISSIYFASDTALALQIVHKHYANPCYGVVGAVPTNKTIDNIKSNTCSTRSMPVSVVVPISARSDDSFASMSNSTSTIISSNNRNPAHLNFAPSHDDPSQFYATFVDLFLMSYSYCVVYGAGNFGLLGSLASFHPRCGMEHHRPAVSSSKPNQCHAF
jgi:hypothetical protein